MTTVPRPTGSGEILPAGQASPFDAIRRVDGRRVMKVEANIAPGVLADNQVKALTQYFEKHPYAGFSDGTVRIRFQGEQEDQAEAAAFLGNAFTLAILLMVIILVTQFNSFYQTVLILSAALTSEPLRNDVRALAPKLGLRVPQLRDLLRILERNDLIRLEPEDPFHVVKVFNRRTHFAKDHPLMRTHQSLFKNMILARLATTPEDEKQSMLATFTMDAPSFGELKKEFQIFLKKAEDISRRSRHDEVYQLSFDLFKWL